MKKLTSLLLVVGTIFCLGVMGCSDLMDSVTPCRVPEKTQEYLGIDKSFVSLLDAKDLALDIDIKHRDILVACQRVVEDDSYDYDLAKEIRNTIIASGEFQDAVIGGPDQPLSLMGLLAGAGLFGVGARFIKRPQERELEKTNGKTNTTV